MLLSEMMHKGVISTFQGINHNKLISLARHEPLFIYKGFYYTQTELELYALAYLHKDQHPVPRVGLAGRLREPLRLASDRRC